WPTDHQRRSGPHSTTWRYRPSGGSRGDSWSAGRSTVPAQSADRRPETAQEADQGGAGCGCLAASASTTDAVRLLVESMDSLSNRPSIFHLLPFLEDSTMSFTNTLAGPARRFLAERVRQLCQRLEQLGRRLREGIAQVISQTVAEGVHEAVHSALDNKSPPPEQPHQTHYWDQDERRMPYEPDPWRDHDGFGWEPPPVAPPPT